MRHHLLLLVVLTACHPTLGGELKPVGKPATQSTNDMDIWADDGFVFVGDTVVYRGNVRVTNGPTTLTCERLTLVFQTNQANSPKMGSPTPPDSPSRTGLQTNRTANTRVERIVAETNVVVTQGDNRATGDRAVYTATNDVVELTGSLVVMETAQGRLECRRVILDRARGAATALSAPGPVRMRLRSDAFGEAGMGFLGTNAMRLPGIRPAAPESRPRK